MLKTIETAAVESDVSFMISAEEGGELFLGCYGRLVVGVVVGIGMLNSRFDEKEIRP